MQAAPRRLAPGQVVLDTTTFTSYRESEQGNLHSYLPKCSIAIYRNVTFLFTEIPTLLFTDYIILTMAF